MSFETEWGSHKQTAGPTEPSPQMRLNQLPADRGGPSAAGTGYGVLATAPPEKKRAAYTIENVLQPGTTKAADAAARAPVRSPSAPRSPRRGGTGG